MSKTKKSSGSSGVASGSNRGNGADAILDAAETLFGRHGIDGVSLRQIGTAAGSANNSAVQYHFGDKEGLIAAIFQRRLESLEKTRAAAFDEVARAGREDDPATILRALLLPIAGERDSAGRCSFAAFLLGLRLFGDITQWGKYTSNARVTRELEERLRSSLADVGGREFSQRVLLAVSVFLIAIVDWDRGVVDTPDRSAQAREQYLLDSLDFAAGGLCAALT